MAWILNIPFKLHKIWAPLAIIWASLAVFQALHNNLTSASLYLCHCQQISLQALQTSNLFLNAGKLIFESKVEGIYFATLCAIGKLMG